MKKTSCVIILVFLLFTNSALADDWIDNWIDQATSSGPNMFEGQKRGYASAGSLSMRFRNEDDYLVNFSPPRFKAGCGGIDVFLGSFSYLDEEYLMKKLERIITGGIATFVFDIGMSVLSEPVQKSMKSLEAIVDRLNQLQIDDCRAAKGVSAYLKSSYSGEDQSEALQAFLIESGYSEFYQGTQDEHANDNTDQVKDEKGVTSESMTAGCPEEMRKAFFTDGSLLANMAEANGIPESQTWIMSAMVGDVVIDNGRFSIIGPCYNDPGDVDALIYGDMITRDGSNQCKTLDHINIGGHNYDSLYQWSHDMIAEIITAMGTKEELSQAATEFIESMPSPVYMMIENDIRIMGDLDNTKEIAGRLAYVSALSYAYYMNKSLFFSTYQLYNDAMRIAHNQLGAATDDECVQKLLEQPATYIKSILERLDSMYAYLDNAYSVIMQRITNDLEQERLLKAKSEGLVRTSFKQTGLP